MFWSNSSQWKSWLQTLSFSLFLRKVIPVCHPLMYVSWYGCCPTSSSPFPHFCICTEAVFNVWGAPQRWTLQTLKTSNFKCLNKPEDDKLTSCECDNEKVCDNEQEIPSLTQRPQLPLPPGLFRALPLPPHRSGMIPRCSTRDCMQPMFLQYFATQFRK